MVEAVIATTVAIDETRIAAGIVAMTNAWLAMTKAPEIVATVGAKRDAEVIATDTTATQVVGNIAGITRRDAAAAGSTGAASRVTGEVATNGEAGNDSPDVREGAGMAGIVVAGANSTLDVGMTDRGTFVADMVALLIAASSTDIKRAFGRDSVTG